MTIEQVSQTTKTRVCVQEKLIYKRHQIVDKDWHLTLMNTQGNKLVVEVIPELLLPIPSKGQLIKACGYVRYDKKHKWYELNPAISIEIIK